MQSYFKSNKGEVILIILLVMAVGLTIGLAVSSRSLTDVQISNKVEESSRAFSAAETGIEKVLEQNLAQISSLPPGTVGSGGQTADYNVNLQDVSEYPGDPTNIYLFPGIIPEGESQVVWLVPHSLSTGTFDDSTRVYNSNSINICWEDKNVDPFTYTALDITVFFKESGEYKVARTAYDPDPSRWSNAGFNDAGSLGNYCSISVTDGHHYRAQLTFDTLTPPIPPIFNSPAVVPIAIRLRPVYADSRLAVQPSGGASSFPVQGKIISSTGNTASGVSRKWDVLNTYAAPQDIFDYAIWSDTDINKPLL